MNLRRLDKPRTRASLSGLAAGGKVGRHDGGAGVGGAGGVDGIEVLVILMMMMIMEDDGAGKRTCKN